MSKNKILLFNNALLKKLDPTGLIPKQFVTLDQEVKDISKVSGGSEITPGIVENGDTVDVDSSSHASLILGGNGGGTLNIPSGLPNGMVVDIINSSPNAIDITADILLSSPLGNGDHNLPGILDACRLYIVGETGSQVAFLINLEGLTLGASGGGL